MDIDIKLSKQQKKSKETKERIFKAAKEILQKSGADQEDVEFYSRYAELQHNAGLLMSKNPQDEEGKRALEEALLKLNKFREDNKGKIDTNNPIIKAIDGSVGNFFTVTQTQTKGMA